MIRFVSQGPVEFTGRHHHSNVPCDLRPSSGGSELFHRFSKSNVGGCQLSVRPQHHASRAEGAGKHP